jgi:hypothetical protein
MFFALSKHKRVKKIDIPTSLIYENENTKTMYMIAPINYSLTTVDAGVQMLKQLLFPVTPYSFIVLFRSLRD